MTALSGIGTRAQNAVQSAWRGTCKKFQQAKEYVSSVKSEVKEQETSSPLAGLDSLKDTAKSAAAAKGVLGELCTKKNSTIGASIAAAAAGFQAIKKMNNNETSKVWAASSGALATASALIHTGMNLANKLNPFAAAFSGAMNGASSSYDINIDVNKEPKTKNIEAGISATLTAGASVGATALAAAAGAGPAVIAGIVIGTPIVAAAGASRTVKLVSDYFRPK